MISEKAQKKCQEAVFEMKALERSLIKEDDPATQYASRMMSQAISHFRRGMANEYGMKLSEVPENAVVA